MQVIYGLYSAVPPSLWFDPEHPLAFALVACLVLGLSVAAATLHKDLLALSWAQQMPPGRRSPQPCASHS